MKHVHYDKIVAKAANMDLVVFSYCNLDQLWSEDTPSQPGVEFIDSSNTDYFLCLPQHKEAVLNVLNGGESQLTFNGTTWDRCNLNQPVEWGKDWWYMKGESQSRIKPKKEKRWIAYTKDQKRACILTFNSESAIKEHYGDEADSFHEIEVEV